MSWFKRLCLFLFGLSGVLALVALSLTWVGPWTTQARSMLEIRWYFITLEVLVCVAGVGSLLCVLVSLFAPRNPRETVVAQVDGNQITVTRAAISSQAKHVVEADGTCIASSIWVRVRKRGNVRVRVRVKPKKPIDVVQRGERLYAELSEGLSHVCGDTVRSIDVVFTEPEQSDMPFARVETEEEVAPMHREAETHQSGTTGAITVPMNAPSPEMVVENAEPEAPELMVERQPDAEADATTSLPASDSEEE
ncbi:MAG: alkaline shock response membrane anchor protein AmaP [Atopobiaceae bacterium]|nr:alkaline shock response membrane anchor protein AmaP [Atopobiaceae bacterium]